MRMDDAQLMRAFEQYGAYYSCPQAPDESAEGLVAALSSRYTVRSGQPKNYLTLEYFNIAHLEQEYPLVFEQLVTELTYHIREALDVQPTDYIFAAPMGGVLLGFRLAQKLGCKYIAAEKLMYPNAERAPKKFELMFHRYAVTPGLRIMLVEDVCDAFSPVIAQLQITKRVGAQPLAVICAVNRSNLTTFLCPGFPDLQIIPLIHHPTKRYQQNDPVVATAVAQERVIWEPKRQWPRLLEALQLYKRGE